MPEFAPRPRRRSLSPRALDTLVPLPGPRVGSSKAPELSSAALPPCSQPGACALFAPCSSSSALSLFSISCPRTARPPKDVRQRRTDAPRPLELSPRPPPATSSRRRAPRARPPRLGRRLVSLDRSDDDESRTLSARRRRFANVARASSSGGPWLRRRRHSSRVGGSSPWRRSQPFVVVVSKLRPARSKPDQAGERARGVCARRRPRTGLLTSRRCVLSAFPSLPRLALLVLTLDSGLCNRSA